MRLNPSVQPTAASREGLPDPLLRAAVRGGRVLGWLVLLLLGQDVTLALGWAIRGLRYAEAEALLARAAAPAADRAPDGGAAGSPAP